MIAAALIVFPKLALGLSGFETGVAVMPLVKGDPGDTRGESRRPHPQHEETPARRCPDHERAADGQQRRDDGVDSGSAAVAGGPAAGRALAYLAHEQLGTLFGTVYDVGDRRHAVVRRSLGARGAAQPGSAVPAALRHGARMGPRQSAAHRDLHADHVRRHARLPRGRRGAGRRIRDRRTGPDHVRRARRRHHEVAAAPGRWFSTAPSPSFSSTPRS